MYPSPNSYPRDTGRALWADIAKGQSIVLVVLGHAAGILTVLGPDLTSAVSSA